MSSDSYVMQEKLENILENENISDFEGYVLVKKSFKYFLARGELDKVLEEARFEVLDVDKGDFVESMQAKG